MDRWGTKIFTYIFNKKRNLDGGPVSGFTKLSPFKNYHTGSTTSPFEKDIIKELREGNVVIIDLSQGDQSFKKSLLIRFVQAYLKMQWIIL